MANEATQALANKMLEAVRGYVSRSIEALGPRFVQLEAAVKVMPERGEKGEPGASVKGDIGPAGADGTSVTLDEVHPFIRDEIARLIALLPVPKDGKDGKEGVNGLKGDPGESVDLKALKAWCSDELNRLMALIPAPKAGLDGKDGKEGQPGPHGEPGQGVDMPALMEALNADLRAMVAALPRPADGKDGIAGPRGEPGDSVDLGALRLEFGAFLRSMVDALPKPVNGTDGAPGKSGESIHPDTVAVMVMEAVEKAVGRIVLPRDGKDGQDGKDAVQIDPLPSIDPAKSYQRGALANHAGGLIRAVRNTDPVKDGRLEDAGWRVVWDGVAGIDVVQSDDARAFSVRLDLTSGLRRAFDFQIPVMIYRDVWRDGEYDKGDVVTWSGSAWHCQQKTADKPGTSETWRLMVKRGADGKEATSPAAPQQVRVK